MGLLNPNILISTEVVELTTILDNYGFISKNIQDKAIKVVSSLGEGGLGTGFLYTGNSHWFQVKSDRQYSKIVESINEPFVDFLSSEIESIIDFKTINFFGVGDSMEVATMVEYINDLAEINLIDISSSSLLSVYSYLSQFENFSVYLYQSDICDKVQIASEETISILKGCTSGNLSNENLFTFLEGVKGDIYFDYFLQTNGVDVLYYYNNNSVKKLAIENYLRLFECAGYSFNNNERFKLINNIKFTIQNDDFGQNVVCYFETPFQIADYFFDNNGVSIPNFIELFHSYRRNENFLEEVYSKFNNCKIKNFTSNLEVNALFISK